MDGRTVAHAAESKKETFRFTGSAKDYFGIWIVNVLLSIVTLGIWSAWAKVRRLRYFYGHTHVLGGALDYLASPWTILKGRILVVAVLAVLSLLQNLFLWAAPVVFLVYLFAVPWVVCRSLRFNARNTIWRNVRFDFAGQWKQAFLAYAVFPVLGVLTLGLLIPVATRKMVCFWADNHALGQARFSTRTKLSSFYKAFGWAVLVFIVVLGTLVISIGLALMGTIDQVGWAALAPMAPFLVFLFLVPTNLIAGSLFSALVRNIVLDGLSLDGGHRFGSNLKPGRYVWIVCSNFLATVFTVGLAHPWAKVRSWRYTSETVWILPGADPEAFVDTQAEAGGAFGSEFTALDAIDLGL